MNKSKLAKLWKTLESLRKRKDNISYREMVKFAEACGRYRVVRGKHPTWESDLPSRSRPISIPSHGKGKSMKAYTAGSILDDLAADLQAIEDELDKQS